MIGATRAIIIIVSCDAAVASLINDPNTRKRHNYVKRDKDLHFVDIQGTLAHLREQISALARQNGPFDGIFGFSQGAILGALMLASASKGLIHGQPAFRFGILAGGCANGSNARGADTFDATLRPTLLSRRINTPTFHIIGVHDQFVAASVNTFLDWFNDAVRGVHLHSGAHTIFPAKRYEACRLADRARDFISLCC